MSTRRPAHQAPPSLQARKITMSKTQLTSTVGVKKTAAKPKTKAASKAEAAPKAKTPAVKKNSSAATAPATTTSTAKGRGRKSKSTAQTTAQATTHATANGKRGRTTSIEDDNSQEEAPAPPAKKSRVTKAPVVKKKAVINEAPTDHLDVFVFGEGANSELGLGTAKKAIDVKRPRLNPLLSAKDVGVVQVATGGMHTAALTHDGKVVTWGVNDSGALGRDTAWEGGLKDMDGDESDDSDDSDSGLNPHESTPTALPAGSFPEETAIVKLAAGDSVTLALTDDGKVFGWGTFRNHSGILGFYKDKEVAEEAERAAKVARKSMPADAGLIETQKSPRLYKELSNIVDIVCGSNHCMALDNKGFIYIWGCGEQNQLGHHINERLDVELKGCLYPSKLRTGNRKYKAIYTGSDHCFAVDLKDQVWSWGLNSFGATGITQGAGDDNAAVFTPTLVRSLSVKDNPIIHIAGGQHHSVAISSKGEALTFGRIDGSQTGLDIKTMDDDRLIMDEHDIPRIVITPTALPNVGHAVYAGAGTDHSIVLNDKGLAYSWGFSANYQTGQGTTDDFAYPTHIDNTAVRGKMLNWCGCGGQFSVMTAPAAAVPNGVVGAKGGGQ